MDRETTRRLLRESIVFLCKTHLGHDARGGFEVDAIICVSRHCGGDNSSVSYSDPRPTVFKFHEHVTDDDGKAFENVNDWLSSGPSQSFVDGLLRQADQVEPSAAKRRKVGEQNAQPELPSYDHFCSSSMQVPDLSLVKQEPGYVEANELTNVNNDMQFDASADQPQLTRRLQSAGATGFDVGFSRSHVETSGAKEVSSASRDIGIKDLEKLVSKPVMSSPPPLKVIPNATEPRRPSNDGYINRPPSHNSNSDHRSETADDLADENVDDSTTGMEQSTPRSCDVCGSVFADFPSFNVHCATVHSRYACPFCALLFPCESTRERHLFEHTGETVDDDGVVNSRPREDELRGSFMSAHHSVHSEFGKRQPEYWSADVMGSMEMSDVEDSTLTAVNGTLYDPQVVTRRGVLSCQTLRAIAQLDPSRPFVCDVCRARFVGSSELCDHCAAVHHRIPCPYCGRSFSQKASMERHQRQHTGERPFQCTLCDSSYTRKENLQTHMSRMHGSSSEFICIE